MTDAELIAKQARRIAELEDRCELDTAARERVGAMIFGIGGPLNDDRYGCSRELRTLFHAIAASLTVAGSVLFGNEEIPFTFSAPANRLVARMTSGATSEGHDSILWTVLSNGLPPLFTFQRDGLTYTAQPVLSGRTFVPEPGTGLLVGLGLAALSRRRR